MAGREILQATDRTHVENRVEDDSTWAQLARDAWSVAGGLAQGIKESAVDLVERPGAALFKAGLVAGGALLLGGMQARAGLLRMGGEALTVGLGMAALNDMHTTFRLAADAYNSANGAQERSASLALAGNRAGQFFFNTGFYGGIALGAARLGQKHFDLSERGSFSYRVDEPPMSSYDRMLMEKMR